jgi:hypothetical protein
MICLHVLSAHPQHYLTLLINMNKHFQEIDYTKEAANAELFASNFKNMDYVKVPSIFWDYTTPQVQPYFLAEI